MQCTKEEWQSLMGYVRDQLLQHKQLVNTIGVTEDGKRTIPINAVSEWTIMGMVDSIKIEQFLADTSVKKERKKVVVTDSGFDQFWSAYPLSANFEYRGMRFKSSRVLRSNYQVCEMLYIKSLKENNVTAEQVLEALKAHVKLVKEESYESGENRLQYFAGIEPYIRQSKYIGFLQDMELTEEDTNYADNNCA